MSRPRESCILGLLVAPSLHLASVDVMKEAILNPVLLEWANRVEFDIRIIRVLLWCGLDIPDPETSLVPTGYAMCRDWSSDRRIPSWYTPCPPPYSMMMMMI